MICTYFSKIMLLLYAIKYTLFCVCTQCYEYWETHTLIRNYCNPNTEWLHQLPEFPPALFRQPLLGLGSGGHTYTFGAYISTSPRASHNHGTAVFRSLAFLHLASCIGIHAFHTGTSGLFPGPLPWLNSPPLHWMCQD